MKYEYDGNHNAITVDLVNLCILTFRAKLKIKCI